LKVSTPEGEPIYAIITPVQQGVVHVEVRPLEVVQEDNPPFSVNGVIRFRAPTGQKFKEIMINLTNYLESLFLKDMAKDENIYSSLGVKPQPRRNTQSHPIRQTRKPIGERDISGVHDSSGGPEQTESSGNGKPDSEVDESGNSSTGE
jgi:hypothetical protein